MGTAEAEDDPFGRGLDAAEAFGRVFEREGVLSRGGGAVAAIGVAAEGAGAPDDEAGG